MNNPIDNFLNKITMYRLVLYVLFGMIGVALFESLFGLIAVHPLNLAASFFVMMVACWGINAALSKIFGVPANAESSYITGAILVLIITPPDFTIVGFAFIALAALFAIASKYLIVWRGKLMFNPAAFAVAATGILFSWYASWWIGGNVPMLPFVLIGGLLVVRKAQRFDLAISFIVAALVSIFATGAATFSLDGLSRALVHTSIFFFAFIMLTEPTTTPPSRSLRVLYGILVGFLFSPAVHFGTIYSTPELALLVGNVFSFAVSPKIKTLLMLRDKKQIGTNIWEFVFEKPKNFAYQPGQYMEWTIPPGAKDDTRGNRRYFTLASAPSEDSVRLAMRTPADGEYTSTFKRSLVALEPGAVVSAGQLTGDFILPDDPTQKIAFLVGGIGVTPVRSMVGEMIQKGEKCDAVLLYSSRFEGDVVFRDVFDTASEKSGLRARYVITDEANSALYGRIDAEYIKKEIPDYADRVFYISGTRAMTLGLSEILRELGVPYYRIKIDFFPGFA